MKPLLASREFRIGFWSTGLFLVMFVLVVAAAA